MTDSHFKHHVFFCLNQRENGTLCCANQGAEAMFEHMKTSCKKISGEGQVRINRAGCLGRCGDGPVLVVYPEAVWYTFVDQADIDEIIDSHLKNGQIVERLKV
jgi:(2Fe-2S) ferredoxin